MSTWTPFGKHHQPGSWTISPIKARQDKPHMREPAHFSFNNSTLKHKDLLPKPQRQSAYLYKEKIYLY